MLKLPYLLKINKSSLDINPLNVALYIYMNKLITIAIAILLFTTCALRAEEESKAIITPLAPGLGVQMLLESHYRCAFWSLIQFYETQIYNTYCGVASAVIVLNAMNIERPTVPKYGTYRLFIQDNFFTDKVSQIVSQESVLQKGMTLDELAKAVSTYDVKTSTVHASQITMDDFREMVKKHTRTRHHFMIANYSRPALHQIGQGHFSPIAAYDEQKDALLVLDVSRYKYTITWVDLPHFFMSMQTIDHEANASRGVLLISPK